MNDRLPRQLMFVKVDYCGLRGESFQKEAFASGASKWLCKRVKDCLKPFCHILPNDQIIGLSKNAILCQSALDSC